MEKNMPKKPEIILGRISIVRFIIKRCGIYFTILIFKKIKMDLR